MGRVSKNLMGLILAGFLVVFLGVVIGIHRLSGNGKIAAELKSDAADQEQLLGELGLKSGWEPYSPAAESGLKVWNPRSVKILFELQEQDGRKMFLADTKKSHGKRRLRKDSLMEFPGGRLDSGESVTEALIRELEEEDPSGVLPDVLRRARKSSDVLSYKNLLLKNGEHHTLFKTPLSGEEWDKLNRYWQQNDPLSMEVYGFSLIPVSALDTRDEHTREQWTPKSKKLLKSLRKSIS